MKIRRQARIVALQTLFEVDSVSHCPEEVLRQRLEDAQLPSEGAEFAHLLVRNVIDHLEQLDPLIRQYAPQWPLEQMALIDRSILRIAIVELLVAETAPVKAVINEAVEVAKLFGSDSSHRFVNGVLGTVLDSGVRIPSVNSLIKESERD